MTALGVSTVRMARRMALDASTAHVVTVFGHLGILCVLLKGPAMATRLYADDLTRRNYTDIDLLVPPRLFSAAGCALAANGYVRAGPSPPSVGGRPYEEAWRRVGNPDVLVDLHRGFHGVGRQERFWDMLHESAESLLVGGTNVKVPDAAGCALLTALHAWPAGTAVRPMADLDRALSCFDDDVWRKPA